ncbi:laminin subunit gamma-1-like isoform X2 [Gordionus sp. m RMFG-2023]
MAICTPEVSDISPLTGGNIAFSTLEGRPSAFNFEFNPELQEWVTATDIRIVLNRLNTFGDELFQDPKVLKSYYYAISDFAVGGRCKCNGHAKECVPSTGQGLPQRLVCRCEHNTAGADCETCAPFYNDRPWQRATASNGFECLPCDCNGLSDRCYFDEDLYRRTGQGGHCIECQRNTDGPHCERCKENYYEGVSPSGLSDRSCEPCGCDPIGSLGMQCNSLGKCPCKTGVAGDKCNVCAANFFGFSETGCRPCGCSEVGSLDRPPRCRSDTGQCVCKSNVEGQACDRCKPGHFDAGLFSDRRYNSPSPPPLSASIMTFDNYLSNPLADDRFGCVECYCFGHSSICAASPRYEARDLLSDFSNGPQRWRAIFLSAEREIEIPYSHDSYDQNLGVVSPVREIEGDEAFNDGPIYFSAPEKYLGDQRFSYNRYLTFKLRVNAPEGSLRPSRYDVQLVSFTGSESTGSEPSLKVGAPIFAQNNPLPVADRFQTFRFRLNQAPEFGWSPQLTFYDFARLLSNLTAIRVRAIYSSPRDANRSGQVDRGTPDKTVGAGFIDDFILQSAKLGTLSGKPAHWVEFCTCPKGYVGQFCESCAAGYKRDRSFGGSTANCLPCECNSHSETCDTESGACICAHNTAGPQCQVCAPGYYGDALFSANRYLDGREEQSRSDTKDLLPRTRRPDTACQPCPCPGGSECFQDDRTQQLICTDCPDGYTGNLCEMCADGFYGRPSTGQPCSACRCNGNMDPNSIGNCDRLTGHCLRCIHNTGGHRCDSCLPGFYGDALADTRKVGDKCKPCDCYLSGTQQIAVQSDSASITGLLCNSKTGYCPCLDRVTGRRCDLCEPGFWDVRSGTGCRSCGCHPHGSSNITCDSETGSCFCKPGISGRSCDACTPNHYGFGAEDGCKECKCDPFGSMSPQCGPDGRCPCKPGTTGIKCNKCEENKFDLRAGCLDCPACYGLVQGRVREQRRHIADLRTVLKDMGERPPALTDTDFEASLNTVYGSLDHLKQEARMATGGDFGISGKIHELADRVETGFELESQILEAARAINRTVLIPVKDRLADETDPALEDLTEALNRASAYYSEEARTAFEAARKAAHEFGSRSAIMSELSGMSRAKIESLTSQSSAIYDLATEAHNVTKKTEELSLNMINGQNALSEDILELNRKYRETETLFNHTRRLSQKAFNTAVEAYDKALSIYQEALETKLPEIDVKDLLRQASDLTEQTNNVFPVIEELLVSNRELLGRARERADLLDHVLTRAIDARGLTDSAMTEALAAKDRAAMALTTAELTLHEARDTLKTLQDFDGEIQTHKKTASMALEQIPKIRALIEETEHKRVETEQKLLSTQSEVEAAKEQALEAKDIMDTIKDQAGILQREVDIILRQSTFLVQKSNQLRDNITRFELSLTEYDEKVNPEASLATEAVLRAEEAQNKASLNLHGVTEALDILADIQDQLENLGVVDKEQLSLLGLELERVVKEVEQIDLDSRLNQLKQAEKTQIVNLLAYTARVSHLKNEVQNIEAIHQSLPEGCFKVLKLEP